MKAEQDLSAPIEGKKARPHDRNGCEQVADGGETERIVEGE